MPSRRLELLPALVAAALLPLALLLVFLWVPDDATDGFSQRIFYIHVPVALTSYAFFGVGAFFAARYLLRRDEADDLRSYVGIHLGVIFGTLVLLTGPIWARISYAVFCLKKKKNKHADCKRSTATA